MTRTIYVSMGLNLSLSTAIATQVPTKTPGGLRKVLISTMMHGVRAVQACATPECKALELAFLDWVKKNSKQRTPKSKDTTTKKCKAEPPLYADIDLGNSDDEGGNQKAAAAVPHPFEEGEEDDDKEEDAYEEAYVDDDEEEALFEG
jgi:hypothetical protein